MMKAAAEGYEQPFEEAAWRKMELLLDEDKEPKRPIAWLWWLLPLFIGAGLGVYFIFNNAGQPGQPADKIIAQPVEQKSDAIKSPANLATGADQETHNDLPSSVEGADVPKPVIKDGRRNNINPVPDRKGEYTKIQRGTVIQNLPAGNIVVKSPKSYKTPDRVNVTTGQNAPVSDAATQKATANAENTAVTAITAIEKNSPDLAVTPTDKKKLTGESTAKPAIDSLDKVSTPNIETGKQSRWYLIVAAGAEGSSPRVFSVDKITARAGVTIGYQLYKNFSVQTGFFAGSKKYVAGPTNYKAKAGTYWSTVDIVKVDANCLVLEIPLDIRYDFRRAKNINIYTTAGLSSYIMSKEDYDYLYNRYGYLHYAKAGYKGNKHVLAVLRLSAGVEKKISKTLSLNAAPALSIPLAGVGEGQVKLHSMEIMAGLRYQPLKKIKKK